MIISHKVGISDYSFPNAHALKDVSLIQTLCLYLEVTRRNDSKRRNGSLASKPEGRLCYSFPSIIHRAFFFLLE